MSDTPGAPAPAPAYTLSPEGRNTQLVVCRLCDCKILLPQKAALVNKSIFLPTSKRTVQATGSSTLEGDTWEHFWVVGDPFQLENMTFSRTVEGIKYLSCGECEKEVIGVQLLPDQRVYVSVDKVKYT